MLSQVVDSGSESEVCISFPSSVALTCPPSLEGKCHLPPLVYEDIETEGDPYAHRASQWWNCDLNLGHPWRAAFEMSAWGDCCQLPGS